MVNKIIKLSASWCMPCHAYAKIFEEVEEMDEYSSIEFESLDIEKSEEGQELAETHGIRSIPTTLFFDNEGSLIGKLVGAASKSALRDKITELNGQGE